MAISQKYLTTEGFKPSSSEVATAELVVNEADGTLWTKSSTGTVFPLGGGAALITQEGLLINIHDPQFAGGVIADGLPHAQNEGAMQAAIDYAHSINDWTPGSGAGTRNQVKLVGAGQLYCDFQIDLNEASCDFENMMIIVDDTKLESDGKEWCVSAGKVNYASIWAHKQDINLNFHGVNSTSDSQSNVKNVIGLRLIGADCAQGTIQIKAAFLGKVFQNNGAENWTVHIWFRRCGVIVEEISDEDSGDSCNYYVTGKHPCVVHRQWRNDGSNTPGGLQVGCSMHLNIEQFSNYGNDWPSWMKNNDYNKGVIQMRSAKLVTYSGYLRAVDNSITGSGSVNACFYVATNNLGTPAGTVVFNNMNVIQCRVGALLYAERAKAVRGTIYGTTIRGDDGGINHEVDAPIIFGRVEGSDLSIQLDQMTYPALLIMGTGTGSNDRPTNCHVSLGMTHQSGNQVPRWVDFENARFNTVKILSNQDFSGIAFGSNSEDNRVIGGRSTMSVSDSGTRSQAYDDASVKYHG